MNYISRNLKFIATATVAAVIGIAATAVFGQEVKIKEKTKEHVEYSYKSKAFCENNNWSNGDKVSTSDLRESTVASTGSIKVDAGQNGGISVKGEDRSDVLVRACVQAWGATEEAARAAAAGIRINTSGEIRADGPSGDKNWSVSYQILVPRTTNTNLRAHNGGISISNVDGDAWFETMNGGVSVTGASGSVTGRTMNGGVNVVLAGPSWKGSGINVQTTNGGVNLVVPENFAANIETGTVNGGFSSNIPALNITTEDHKGDGMGRSRARRIQTSLNGGGAPVRVMTTNGGVQIRTSDKD